MALFKCLLATVLICSSLAANAFCSQNALIEELYVKSGLEKQVKQTPNSVEQGFDEAVHKDENLRRMPQSVISGIRSLIEEAFAPELLKNEIIKEMEAGMEDEHVKRVLEWLESGLGRKCTAAEEAASRPNALSAIQLMAAQIRTSPPPPDRLNLMRRLDQAMGATETLVSLALNTQIAVASAIAASLPPEQQQPLSELKKQIELTRPQLESAMNAYVLASFLYTYQTLSNPEIRAYINFAASRTGKIYHKVTVAGFTQAMISASIKWGKSIGALLSETGKTYDALNNAIELRAV